MSSLFAPPAKHIPLHKLIAMSTMLSPTHNHFKPAIQAGGGDATADVPSHQLYFSHAILEHLQRVYDSLRGPNEVLPKGKFVAWLADVQSQSIDGLDKDEYTFEGFLETVYMGQGFEALRVSSEEKDLSRPLSNYYISSSHNTYLSGNQLSSKSSTEAYANVLRRGCRCIEIDVHNGEFPDDKSDDGRSKSRSPSEVPKDFPSPTRGEHKRHISGSTLSSRGAALFEEAGEKFDRAKSIWNSKRGKDKSPHEERGRQITSSSLETPSSMPPRASSVRSLMNGEPLVLHGWTLTAPVGFRAVCKTIRETAFETSKLPLIVSLEVHADPEQQEVMVDIMKEEWKGLLIETPNEGCNPDERLPRLEELQEKILIKVKKAAADSQKDLHPAPGSTSSTLSPATTTETDAISIASNSEDDRAQSSSQKKKVKICENLSNLGVYTHSAHFISFEAKSAKTPPHIYSIGEKEIMELYEERQAAMLAHNRDFFMRAYPAGFRIDSSNLDASQFWRKGVQMVALNWQKLDEGMMLNEGMFAGEHGWVLKPKGYRSDPDEAIHFQNLDLKIRVLAGQHIPLPEETKEKSFHPYVKCELHIEKEIEGGVKIKGDDYKKETPWQKGDSPDYGPDGFTLHFPSIQKIVEELSFVRFKIEDARFARDDLAAWACIRLDRLQQGYRFVRLFDAKGIATAGCFLVHIEKKLVDWVNPAAKTAASKELGVRSK